MVGSLANLEVSIVIYVYLSAFLVLSDGEQSWVALRHGTVNGEEWRKRAGVVVGRIGIEHLAVGQANRKEVFDRGLSGCRPQRDRLPARGIDQCHVSCRPDRAAGATLLPLFCLQHPFFRHTFRTTTSSFRFHGFISSQSRFLYFLRS